MKPWLLPCVLTLVTALLTACAGGGSDDNDGDDGNDSGTATSSQQRLSGSVSQEGGPPTRIPSALRSSVTMATIL